MRIGIDISQLAYEKTGVANYLRNFVQGLLAVDSHNEYILFYSSLRKSLNASTLNLIHAKNVSLKRFKMPPKLLDLIWNKLHIFPIEWFIGSVDVFISSDWTQPPATKAKMVTILYDLVVYKYPQETATQIIDTQKRKLAWVKKECDLIFCISESTKTDAMKILNIQKDKLHVAYPGFSIHYANRN
jgi:hypothetical protein